MLEAARCKQRSSPTWCMPQPAGPHDGHVAAHGALHAGSHASHVAAHGAIHAQGHVWRARHAAPPPTWHPVSPARTLHRQQMRQSGF